MNNNYSFELERTINDLLSYEELTKNLDYLNDDIIKIDDKVIKNAINVLIETNNKLDRNEFVKNVISELIDALKEAEIITNKGLYQEIIRLIKIYKSIN